ncbi:pentapeptide repeat-containing protein [Streptomyces sp. NPDC059631]|uniref:pentapeptide repeat-containing protein n=1 Tax=Streptomyces sp. NPDC059631 TaxID=3346890 RepID=UPI00367D5BF1
MNSPLLSQPPPSWPHCGHGANSPTDLVGCRGIHVPGHAACLAHLSLTDRTNYLVGLAPGADIDHRGTPFTEDLLGELLTVLRDPATLLPHFGIAHFEEAQFIDRATFRRALFTGSALFRGATFAARTSFDEAHFTNEAIFDNAQFDAGTSFGEAQFASRASFSEARFGHDAWFGEAQFGGLAQFVRTEFASEAGFGGAQFIDRALFTKAQFAGEAIFGGARFTGRAVFVKARFTGRGGFARARFASDATFEQAVFDDEAIFGGARFAGITNFRETQFEGGARFTRTEFTGDAMFAKALFTGDARFGAAQFAGDARFDDAQFMTASRFGPVVCAGTISLTGAAFRAPVTMEIAATSVGCVRTQWESTATVRLRHAAVDLSYAVLVAPVAVTAHPVPFTLGNAVDEGLLTGPESVSVTSVQGLDAAHLVLTDTDLSDCLFGGAFHLEQLRLEGRTALARTPTGWRRRGLVPLRWTRRRTLAEEHHWRAQNTNQPTPAPNAATSPRQWRAGPHHPDPVHTPDPEDVAALYRQLRRAFEDSKNEPGAADFYYGECEMRRHDRTGTPKTERGLLWAYWLLSGYGLRASRALGWLAAAMLTTIVLLMGFGLPAKEPEQTATGTVPADGGRVTFDIGKDDPQNPTGNRFTSERFDKALNVTLNSVVFRSADQDLTTTGTYIEMTSRLTEPILLGLAALAIRGRIKR